MDILGTNVDAKEVHARFLLFSESLTLCNLGRSGRAVGP